MEFDWDIEGIPCIVEVTHFNHVEPDFYADNTDDFKGGYEIEFNILDARGKYAQWLESKLNAADIEAIEQAIIRKYR